MAACCLKQSQWDGRLALGVPARMFLVQESSPAFTLTKAYRRMPGRRAGTKFGQAALRKEKAAAAAVAAQKKGGEKTGVVAVIAGGGRGKGLQRAGKRRKTELQGTADDAAVTDGDAAADAAATSATSFTRTRSGTGWHNLVPAEPRPRFFTPRECARLQGFPEAFQIARAHEDPNGPHAALFGNAVSPPVVAAVAGAMLDSLDLLPPGTSVLATALEMVLEAVPERSVERLHGCVTDAMAAAASEAVAVAAEPPGVNAAGGGGVCYKWQRTGKCAWGKGCRWAHVPSE